MLTDYYFESINDVDLNMYHCGTHDCEPGHSFGPAVRDHYLIHYIFQGKGFFRADGITHYLEKGQGFLIYPDEVTYYESDGDEPWSYCWAGFQGLKAEKYLENANFTRGNPTFNYNKDNYIRDCIQNMISANEFGINREIQQVGWLYLLLSKITESTTESTFKNRDENIKEHYVKKAVAFISMNYSENISINQIAHHIGLDRSYFCTIFKECLHISPKEFLINFRINKACELMQKSELSIGDVSRSVGYQDPLQFSKILKKYKGASPREYRKMQVK